MRARTRSILGWRTSDTAPFVCACGRLLDQATAAPLLGTRPDDKPEMGSLTICIDCARVYRFRSDMTLERCDVEALDERTRKEVRRGQAILARGRKS